MNEVIDLRGPEEWWIIEKVTGETVTLYGRFIFDVRGRPLWLQVGEQVIFMTGILSAERKPEMRWGV